MKKACGSVYIVGAGPGDLEYLTIKALRFLQKADVVLLDSLVNPAIIRYLRSDTRIIYVGKRGGAASTPQSHICALMIDLTRQGLCIARVKGGDPFVFGRAGEEITALAEAGITVEVCSGISSGLAIPSALGIPLTHRDLASSFVFITGNQKDNCESMDWHALVKSNSTIVAFMALSKAAKVARNLINAGLAGDTPAVAVQDGTLPEQKIIFSRLDQLGERVKKAGLISPTLLIVGKVVKLSPFWPNYPSADKEMVLAVSAITAGTNSLSLMAENVT